MREKGFLYGGVFTSSWGLLPHTSSSLPVLSSSSQGCDLPEQSTVHVVLPQSGSSSSHLLLLQERLARGGEEEPDSLTRLDLSSSRLLSTSTGLAVILQGADGGAEEATEKGNAASLKGQSSNSVRTAVESQSQHSDCVYLCVPVCTCVCRCAYSQYFLCVL